ncbi:MAG: hypothetical protein ISR96_00215 [Nitrospira sp.]|nr:hypothetical protein [Nitrospira sp.]
MNTKHYNTEVRRYISEDPIGFDGRDVNLYAYVGNNPVNAIDPDGRWAIDVHSGIGNSRYGTYLWAQQAGFSANEAKIIAIANNAVDTAPWTNWMPLMGDQTRHFNQGNGSGDTRTQWADRELQRAVKFAKAGNCKAALGHLGKGLHSIQDTYAHRDWNTEFFGMTQHPEWYDTWSDSRNSEAAASTRQATDNYLKHFLSLTN